MKYVEIISTPCGGKAKHIRIFQMALRDRGDISPYSGGWGMGNFCEARILSSCDQNLLRRNFDH